MIFIILKRVTFYPEVIQGSALPSKMCVNIWFMSVFLFNIQRLENMCETKQNLNYQAL
jgi:hypothetical protein